MHGHAFMDIMDPSLGTDFAAIAPVMGGGYPPYNSIEYLDYNTMRMEKYFPGKTHLVQEPVFIARHVAGEGDGWIVALVNNYSTMSSELHIVSTKQFGKAQAIIYLPLRLRAGLHGNWVNGQEIRFS